MVTVCGNVTCSMKGRESEHQWCIAVAPPTPPAVEGNHTVEHTTAAIHCISN